MESIREIASAAETAPPAQSECFQDARRKKIPPDFKIHMTSDTKKPRNRAPPSVPLMKPVPQDFPTILLNHADEEAEAMEELDSAVSDTCGEPKVEVVEGVGDTVEIPTPDPAVVEPTPENAPFDLVLDFMAAVIKECFQEALKLANAILKFEPTNATIQEYLPILQELILLEKEEGDSSSSSGSESMDSEEETCSSSSEDSDLSNPEPPIEGAEAESEDSTSTSISTVASDEYLSEYGEEYEHPVPAKDDGYETNPPPVEEEE